MDPELLDRFMAEGKLPNFSRLRETGSYVELATTNPPQSPVAWSSFITGTNPGKHNIFDFLTRDPKTYLPKLTIAEVEEPDTLSLGPVQIPIGRAKIKAYRQGTPFWEIADRAGIPTVSLLVPVTFPPDPHAKILSGMGVPDLLGTNGTFSFYTTEPETGEGEPVGGKIYRVEFRGAETETRIFGPKNSFRKDGANVELPLVIRKIGTEGATVSVQGHEIDLAVRQWSDWVRLKFKLAPFIAVSGIVRFYLIGVEPRFDLYMTPINIDPENPSLPVSNPPDYVEELSHLFGLFYTQGMPEDTWALNEERIEEDVFLELTRNIQQGRFRIYKHELKQLTSGILVAVFVSSDRIQHMFWRTADPDHPLYTPESAERYGTAILEVYEHMDEILGSTLPYLDDRTTLIVMSDHGFTSYRRSVHLNTWLIQNGFMKTLDPNKPESGEFLENVDFSGTVAYAMGLNGIFLNLKGREAQGIVRPGIEAETVKREISEKLVQLQDPETGLPAVQTVYDGNTEYPGPYRENGPDLVVGYHRSYRASWQTALGAAPATLFHDNDKKWSGDHCTAPNLVPGILLSNRKIAADRASIMDLAPSILGIYGIDAEGEFDGRSIFR
jgi:predicted AlkP superfamily phosphohydrolase/phosphomutase